MSDAFLVSLAGPDPTLRTVTVCAATWVSACVDRACGLIPDLVTLPLLISGLVLVPDLDPARGAITLAGALVGLATSLAVHFLGQRRFGWGDVKLITAIGAWVGPVWIAEIFLEASALMAALFIFRRSLIRAPFAPALAATLLFTVVRNTIINNGGAQI